MTPESHNELPYDDYPLDGPDGSTQGDNTRGPLFDRPTDYFTIEDGEVLPPEAATKTTEVDPDLATEELEHSHPWIDNGAAVLTLADMQLDDLDAKGFVTTAADRAMPHDGAVAMPEHIKLQVAALAARNEAKREEEGPLFPNAIPSTGYADMELKALQATQSRDVSRNRRRG